MEQEKSVSTEIRTEDLQFEVDKSKSFNEQAKDMVGAIATKKAIEDANLQKDITDTKKKELKNNAEKELKKEQESLQEAEFGIYKGIASYAGIKKPLPQKYQKFLFTMYMILLFPFQLTVGSVFCIVNFFADCADSFFEKLSSIARSAKILVLSLLVLGAIALAIYIVINIFQKYHILG